MNAWKEFVSKSSFAVDAVVWCYLQHANVVCLLHTAPASRSDFCFSAFSEWHFDCRWSAVVCLQMWSVVMLQILHFSRSPSMTNLQQTKLCYTSGLAGVTWTADFERWLIFVTWGFMHNKPIYATCRTVFENEWEMHRDVIHQCANLPVHKRQSIFKPVNQTTTIKIK